MLNVALSGLRAFQSALDTTSHNIANVGTAGFSRQRTELGTQTPYGIAGHTTGSGVTVTGISRSADDLLAAQMRRASSAYTRLEAYADRAGTLNNLFADSRTGLPVALQKFTNALQGVANTPTSSASRQVLLSEANGLVARLQTYQAQLDELDTGINEQLRAESASINTIAQNIAQLNAQILRVSGSGNSPPNDLLDARDRQLAELATRVDTTVVMQDDGALNVFIGKGQPLVLGDLASQVEAVPDKFQPDRLTLALSSPAGPIELSSSLSGGSVGGLLDFRREMLDPARAEIGRMAVALASASNAQHRAGQDLYGDMGGDFFAVGDPQVLNGRTNAGSATLTATRTATGQLVADDYILRYQGSTWQVQRAGTGQPVAFTIGGSGQLQFDGLSVAVSGAAQAGDQFMVRPAGAAVTGLRVLITDTSRVAAAAPIRSAAVAANTGSGSISAGAVLDAGSATLRDPVTIRFTAPGAWQALDAGNAVIAAGVYTPGGNIDVNGWRVQVDGAPATGDAFTVSSNIGGVGDNRNALQLAGIAARGVLANGTESLDAAAARLVGTVGVATNSANASLAAQQIIYEDSRGAIDSMAGVNLDEEAANLLRYQQAYQAAAQMIRVTQTIFDTLISSVNR